MLFFRDFSRFFRNFAKILPEFLEISRKSIKFANFYEFQGVPDKTRTQIRIETQRRPVVLPLRGAEVLVAVRGPSPGEGGREKLTSNMVLMLNLPLFEMISSQAAKATICSMASGGTEVAASTAFGVYLDFSLKFQRISREFPQ